MGYQNFTPQKIKSRLNLGNASYHSVQNFLSSCLLPRNVKIQVQKAVTVLSVLDRCEAWSVSLQEKQRLMGCFGTEC